MKFWYTFGTTFMSSEKIHNLLKNLVVTTLIRKPQPNLTLISQNILITINFHFK